MTITIEDLTVAATVAIVTTTTMMVAKTMTIVQRKNGYLRISRNNDNDHDNNNVN